MKRSLIAILLLVLGIGAFAVVLFGGTYNRMVDLDEQVGEAWSQVENVYQRRADLVPNLVSTVQGAADFERQTFESITEARSRVGSINIEGAPSAADMQRFQANQDSLSSALSRLLVVVENYPQLTATQAFRDLQAQLEGTENRIAVERRRYNEVARAYNTARRRFPTLLVAGLLGFDEHPYFEAEAGADTAPEVDFSSSDG